MFNSGSNRYNGAMPRSASITESDILADVILPEEGDLSPAVAESVLRWHFSDGANARIQRLAQRNQQGTITPDERQELEKYLRVGSLVNILQAKARRSLQNLQPD
jgi:hypothetical protein